MSNLVHHQASVKDSIEEMFNKSLWKTNWVITSKEKVKLIIIFSDDELLILSIYSESEMIRSLKKF